MRAAFLAPNLHRVMKEGESKQAALILMKNSHFDGALRYLCRKIPTFANNAAIQFFNVCHIYPVQKLTYHVEVLKKRDFVKFFCVRWPLNIFDQNGIQMCFRNSPIQSLKSRYRREMSVVYLYLNWRADLGIVLMFILPGVK